MAMRKAEWFWLSLNESESERPVPVTEFEVEKIEQRLGVKLPAAYLALFRLQNGGYPDWSIYWNPGENVCWGRVFEDGPSPLGHLETLQQFVDGIDFGGGFGWGEFFADMHLMVVIASHGSDALTCLDYRKCGPEGEPEVVAVDAVSGPQIRHQARDFSTLLSSLCMPSDYGFEIALNVAGGDLPQFLTGVEDAFSIALNPVEVDWATFAGTIYTAVSTDTSINRISLEPNTGLSRQMLPEAAWVLKIDTRERFSMARIKVLDAWISQALSKLGDNACVLAVPELYSCPEDAERLNAPEFIATMLRLHQRDAEAGNINAMQTLGKIYGNWNGYYAYQGYPVDPAASRRWFEQALQTIRTEMASDNQELAAIATRHLGEAYQEGYGVEPNLEEALQWYEMAAARNEYWAMIALGRIYIGDSYQNFERAEFWLLEARKLWDASFADDVLNELERKKQAAISTHDGINEDNVDYVLDMAAEGDARAMLQVAQCCLDGRFGFSADTHNAVAWLEKAVAQYTSVLNDAVEKEPLRYAAREAAAKLAELYDSGARDFQANPAEALRWCRRAAWLGSRENMIYIALGLTDGSLDQHDPVQAYAWVEIAKRSRYDDDDLECPTLESTSDYLRNMLDSAQLGEANALISQCVDRPPYPLPDDFRGKFKPAAADSNARLEPPALTTIPRNEVRRHWDELPGRADYERAAECVSQGDWGAAQEAFFRAAQAGHVRSMVEIAKIHASGNGGTADALLAARWYYLAAEMQDDGSAGGSSAAMAWLGYACIRGLLHKGESDPVTGYVWYALASRPRYNYTDKTSAPYVETWLEFVRDQQERCATLLTEAQKEAAREILAALDEGPPFRLPARPSGTFGE